MAARGASGGRACPRFLWQRRAATIRADDQSAHPRSVVKLKDAPLRDPGQAPGGGGPARGRGPLDPEAEHRQPRVFGFEALFQIVRDMISAIPMLGYSDSRHHPPRRWGRATATRRSGLPPFSPMSVPGQRRVRAHHDGDAVAVRRGRRGAHPPARLSRCWTAMTSLGGGPTCAYSSDEASGWCSPTSTTSAR